MDARLRVNRDLLNRANHARCCHCHVTETLKFCAAGEHQVTIRSGRETGDRFERSPELFTQALQTGVRQAQLLKGR